MGNVNSHMGSHMGSQMNIPRTPIGGNTNLASYDQNPLPIIETKDYDDPVCFVQVRLKDDRGEIFARTDCSRGLDPEFNESLVINYFSHDPEDKKFTINELIKNEGHLYISLFDYLDSFGERAELPGEIAIEINRKYIGTIDIPLYTIFENPKMNSMFKVNRPFFLFGYLSKRNNIWAIDSIGDTDIMDP